MSGSGQVAVIADVVDSRGYDSREHVQRAIEQRLSEAEELIGAVEPFRATVGDELQAVYPTRQHALAATLWIQLITPDGEPQLRFGMGEGQTTAISSATSESIQDGPGWWAAREAIEELEHLQDQHAWLSTWYCAAEQQETALVRAYLLSRESLVAQLSVRVRRYAAAMLVGHTQKRIAADHGVSQPAVSQALKDPRVKALTEGVQLLTASTRQTP